MSQSLATTLTCRAMSILRTGFGQKNPFGAHRTLTDDPSLRLVPERRHQPMRNDITVDNVADQVWLRRISNSA